MQEIIIFNEVVDLLQTKTFKLDFYQKFDLLSDTPVEKQIHFNDFLNSITSHIDFNDVMQIKKDAKQKKYVRVKGENIKSHSYIREKRLANYKLKEIFYEVVRLLSLCQQELTDRLNKIREDFVHREFLPDNLGGITEQFLINYNLLQEVDQEILIKALESTDVSREVRQTILLAN